ncbi:MAG: hypothetical protein AB7U41_00480 [Dongiaceae bacterium]
MPYKDTKISLTNINNVQKITATAIKTANNRLTQAGRVEQREKWGQLLKTIRGNPFLGQGHALSPRFYLLIIKQTAFIAWPMITHRR